MTKEDVTGDRPKKVSEKNVLKKQEKKQKSSVKT